MEDLKLQYDIIDELSYCTGVIEGIEKVMYLLGDFFEEGKEAKDEIEAFCTITQMPKYSELLYILQDKLQDICTKQWDLIKEMEDIKFNKNEIERTNKNDI